jgi:tyrosine-protein kinase Etk/Wzc
MAAYTYTQPSVYQASALVKVDPESSGPAQVTQSIVSGAAAGEVPTLSGEVGVLRNSLEIARQAVVRLHAPTASNADGATMDTTQAARRILRKVTFEPRPETNMIQITVESREPEKASAITNTYAQAYRRYSQQKARASVQAARRFLEKQAQQQREKIERLEQRWKTFVRSNRLVTQGEEGEHLTTKFNELKARRDELAFEIDQAKTQLKLLRGRMQDLQPRLKENIFEKQEASSLRSKIHALEDRIAGMRAEAASYYATNPELEGDTTRIRTDFPDLARLLDRVEALEDRKRVLTTKLAKKVSDPEATVSVEGDPISRASTLRQKITEKRLEVTQLQSQAAALDSQITRFKSKLGEIPKQQVQREQIERKLDQAEAFHETIMSKLQRAGVATESELGYVKIVREATIPAVPVRPNVKLNLVLGLLLGLAFGVGIAFLREATNTRLRHPEDIEKKGYELLGVVPDIEPEVKRLYSGRDHVEVEGRQMSTQLMPLLNPWSFVTENYRMIRVNLQDPAQERPRTLMVTSAEKGEGKTLTAVNLALTEALSGQRTLLIDADMRNPSAHEMLGMSRQPGLASVLGDMPDASCWETAIDGLYFIPAGVAETAPPIILDSGQIPQLLDATEQHFDVVIVDTPPTQVATEAVIIGAQTNARAVVVSAAEGDVRSLDSAVHSLRGADVEVAGVVLNRYRGEKAHQNELYDYSYYGRDEGEAEREVKALKGAGSA